MKIVGGMVHTGKSEGSRVAEKSMGNRVTQGRQIALERRIRSGATSK